MWDKNADAESDTLEWWWAMETKSIGRLDLKPVTISNGLRLVVLLTNLLYANSAKSKIKSKFFKFSPTWAKKIS